MVAVPLPILTTRLALRAYEPDDAEQVHDVLYGDAEVMRHVGGPLDVFATRAALERYAALQASRGFAFWALVERETGLIAGEAGLVPLGGEGPEVELGYTLGRAFWGRGYATEAGGAVVGEAFGALGLDRLVAVTRVENAASQRVLAKLGFAPAGRRHAWGAEQLLFERRR